jgi:hypothetical protein
MNFLFEVAFTCNGVYDATATATARVGENPNPNDFTYALQLAGLHVAVPPQPPPTFLATDNGDQTVTLTWQPPNDQPPDLVGYRLSRREPAAASFTALGDTPRDSFTFADIEIPVDGGSYFYEVQTLRSSPNGTLVSSAMVSSEALVVSGGTGGGGRSVGGIPAPQSPAQSPGDGTQHFDETTLAADEGEPGEGDLALPGAGTIQRFAGREGAGLIKPFAAALDLAVWAGLLLFLTRRAKRAAREDALAIELEHSP